MLRMYLGEWTCIAVCACGVCVWGGVLKRAYRYHPAKGHPHLNAAHYRAHMCVLLRVPPCSKAMEMIMAYVNARPKTFGLRLIYSSPAAYFEAVAAHDERQRDGGGTAAAVPTFDGDFFPPAFSAHYVRAGFFSSRPASKALDRAVWGRGDAAKRLRVLRHAESAVGTAALDAAVAAVDASVGVHQHHDAMSGTDLVTVADNYRQMMIAADELAVPASAAAAAWLAGVPESAAGSFAGCVQSNVSVCGATAPLQQGKPITLVLFNPLARARTQVLAVPIPVAGVTVSNRVAGIVASEVHEAIFIDHTQADARNFTLFVNVSLAPLSTLQLLLTPDSGRDQQVVRWSLAPAGSTVSLVAKGGASATVDGDTGALASIGSRAVASSLEFYVPNAGSKSQAGFSAGGACSSAYAFLPEPGGTTPFGTADAAVVKVAKGVLVQQTHVVVDSKAGVELGVRVVAGEPSVRLLAKLGPLDTTNGVGQEAVLILDRCKATAGPCAFGRTWWTDANALQMVERRWRDNSTTPKTAMGTPYTVWEPEAQNYYPSTAMAALRGGSSAEALTVAFNAAHGVTSRSAGALELMLHRRIVDHGCRTDEGFQMNDTHPVIADLRVQAPSDPANAAAAYRTDALDVLHPVQAFFGPASTLGADHSRSAACTLPENVHLHTLRALGTDLAEATQRCDPFASVEICAGAIEQSRLAASEQQQQQPPPPLELLVRLQHLYAVGEDAVLSQPATIDMAAFLAAALPGLKVGSVVETTLVAAKVINVAPGTRVTLEPLQIRTFLVTMTQ